MNEMTPPKAERAAALKGLGTARKRVEDARFTQGKGNYVDDLKLPGMLFGDFVRSPYAHARIRSINADKAMYQGVGRPEYAWNSFAAARNQKVTGHSVTATWQATDSLTVKNIFGYRKSSVFAPTSLDGISGVTFTQGAVVPYAQFIILGQLFSDPNFLTLPPAQQPAAIGAALAGTQQC